VNLNNKKQKLVRKLTNKEYRDAWVDESVKTVVPYQIQAMRNQRGWSQTLLGEKAGMLPNAVSRLESIDYGNLSVNTLLRIAHGFDCGLLVKFVPFSRLVREFEDVSPSALEVDNFDDNYGNLMSWVDEKTLEVAGSYQKYSTEKPSYKEDLVNDQYSFYKPIEANSSFVN
jgi:transcriptional regulator with XRE-family HTH domain